MKLIVQCARCNEEFTYNNLEDMEKILHWRNTDAHKKCDCLDGHSYMMCNDCAKQYKTFETETNAHIKDAFKNFMSTTPIKPIV